MIHLKQNDGPGKLVVFEGTDGAGKTTLIRMAEAYLAERIGKENVLVTKQPTDMSRKTKLFQKMMYSRDNADIDYRAVQLLTLSDRVQHNHEVIEPALNAGKFVVCDRYLYTSVANMFARGYRSEDWFFNACRGIVRPDATFLASVPPKLAIGRIRSRPEESGRFLDEDLLGKVYAEFLQLCEWEGFEKIDTSASAERAFERVERELNRLTEARAVASEKPASNRREEQGSRLTRRRVKHEAV